jgi:NAD(P)H-flavin reductase
LSREQADSYNSGYVTDFLKEKNIDSFEEFYICGAPAMIDSAKDTLECF